MNIFPTISTLYLYMTYILRSTYMFCYANINDECFFILLLHFTAVWEKVLQRKICALLNLFANNFLLLKRLHCSRNIAIYTVALWTRCKFFARKYLYSSICSVCQIILLCVTRLYDQMCVFFSKTKLHFATWTILYNLS